MKQKKRGEEKQEEFGFKEGKIEEQGMEEEEEEDFRWLDFRVDRYMRGLVLGLRCRCV